MTGDSWFVWSPIAAWLLAYVVVPLGYPVWFALHVAAVALLRDARLIALVAVSLPFWLDTIVGSTFVFVFVAGMLAITGSRWGALAYLALCCLIPRPIQLPAAAWLVWTRPETRMPSAVLAGTTLGIAAASGLLDDWVTALLTLSAANHGAVVDYGPTRWLGPAWLAIGLPLAAVLTVRGRLGLASLAATSYLTPHYWLVILYEMRASETPARER